MDPDQLASEKPADQDLHCYQNGIYAGSAWSELSTSHKAFSSNFEKSPWPKLGKNERVNIKIGEKLTT